MARVGRAIQVGPDRHERSETTTPSGRRGMERTPAALTLAPLLVSYGTLVSLSGNVNPYQPLVVAIRSTASVAGFMARSNIAAVAAIPASSKK